MGIGDAIMAAGEARVLYERDGRDVMIMGAHGRPIWSEVFDGNPHLIRRFNGKHVHKIINGGGVRPYIELKTPIRWYWRPYTPKPAELFFTTEELLFAEPFRGRVMIEPNVKDVGHNNKAWPPLRWQELARVLDADRIRLVQCGGPESVQRLLAAQPVLTPTFRHAAAVLRVCKAFVGTDGGLMHAAAAVGTPAVILWSEFTSPDICGYKSMVNLRHAGRPCGNRLNCKGCRAAMEKITVAEVVAALKGIL